MAWPPHAVTRLEQGSAVGWSHIAQPPQRATAIPPRHRGMTSDVMASMFVVA